MKKRANLVFCIIISLIVAIFIAKFKGYKNNKNYSAANYTTKEYKTKTTTFSANAVVNEKILVKEGEELDLTTYLNNNNEQLLWNSENSEIATINANGVVKGVKLGKTTITAKNSSNEVVLSVDIIVGINNNFIDIKNTKLNTFVKNVQPKILFNGEYRPLGTNVMQGFAIKDNYIYITQDNKHGLIVSKMKYNLNNKSVTNLVDAKGNKLEGNAEYMILNDTSHGDSFEVEVDKNLNSWIWLPTIKNSNGVPTAISRMKNISNNTDKWDATNKIAKYSYNFKSIDSNQQVNTWTVGNGYSSMSLDEKNGLISIRSGSTINHVYNIYKLDEWNEKGLNASEIITIKHSPLTHINSLFKKKFGETKYISIRNHAFSNRIIGSCRQGADIDGSYLYIYETLAVTKTSDMNNIQTTDEGYTYTVDDIIDIVKSESEYLKDKSNVIKCKNTTTGVISEGYESDTYISIYDLAGNVVPGYYRYNVEKELGDKISEVDFYKSYKNDGFAYYEREGLKVQDGIVYIGNTSVKADENNVYSNTKYQNILYFAEGILTGIKITTPPTKTSYVEGQDFDKTGMVISATYNNDSGDISKSITEYTVTNGKGLKVGQTSVTISYTENGITKETTQEIRVDEKTLSSIEITSAPTKVNYVEGQNFDKTGMKVQAKYNDGTSKEITDYKVTNGENLKLDQTSITISYTENGVTKKVSQTIKVEAKALSSIKITNEPTKISYVEGQNFESAGMKVEASYNNGTSKEVTDYKVTNGENLKLDQASVIISYTENEITKETTQAIKVVAKELAGIKITNAPTKVSYIEGQNFESAGMKVEASYNNGTSKEVTDYKVTNGESLKLDQTSVTISYTENGVTKKVSQTIKVEAKILSSIKITTPPTKTSYIVGENFESAGMKVEANYNNGTSKEVTNYTVTNGENLKLDQASVIISYTENGVIKETSQKIIVATKLLSSIEIMNAPTKVNYVEGQNFESEGMKVKANYNNGTSKEVTDYKVTNGESLKLDQTSVIISYTENGVTKKVSQTIKVEAKALSSIEITKEPTKVNYVEGQNFESEGMKVKANYNNGTSKEVTDYKVTNGEDLKVGQTSVTISYTENGVTKEVNQEITVVAKKLTSIEITTPPTKTSYVEGQRFDTRGMVVKANYNDETSKEITGYTVINGESLKVDQTSVTISYTENGVTKEVNQEIKVTKEEKLEVKIKAEVEYKLEKEKGYIENINPKTTVKELLDKIETNGEIKIYKEEAEITEDGKLATGMKIRITKGLEMQEYTVIIIGDCNGNGATNVADLTRLMMSKAEDMAENKDESKILKGAFREAVDLNKDNKISVSDITRLCMFIAENK